MVELTDVTFARQTARVDTGSVLFGNETFDPFGLRECLPADLFVVPRETAVSIGSVSLVDAELEQIATTPTN